MQFKTKDLLVTVLPKAQVSEADIAKLCLLRTIICQYPTFHCRVTCIAVSVNCLPCSHFFTRPCGLGTCGRSNCDPTVYCAGASIDFVIQNPEDLVTLKTELQATIKSLDAMQKEGFASSFGSKSQADEMERGLTEALEQVRAAKKKL